MTAKVDPYLLPIPSEITKKDGTPTDEFKQWLIYNNRFNHDLWQVATGGTGSGGGSLDAETLVIENDYTTDGTQNLYCTNDSLITITLTESPLDNELVTISRRRAMVNVVGSINGKTNKYITGTYSTMVLKYSDGLNEWVIS